MSMSMSSMPTAISVLTIVLSLAATILAFVFIIPEKKRGTLNNFLKVVHDILNFKFLIIEKIFQFLYVLATAVTVIGGFFTLFTFTETYNWRTGKYTTVWEGYWGFLIMILGPIVVRIAYELIMMAILAVKNIIQINSKLKNQNEGEVDDIFSTEKITAQIPIAQKPAAPVTPAPAAPVTPAPAAPAAKFCSQCGSPLRPDGTCPRCN